jgi:carboxypeptidase family protein
METKSCGLTVSLAALSIAGGLCAQGRVRGVAYDSLLGRPLAGASVWLRDLDRSTLTDSTGRFTLNDVPTGPHVFLLDHPDLDSAGLGIVAAAVTVERDREVVLAVPSIGTIWRRLCGGDISGADSAIVFGAVRDADSRTLLSGVTVTVVWPHLTLAALRHEGVETRADSAMTDSTGTYRICGVATGLNVHAQAQAGSFATGIVQLMAGERPVARRDFSLSRRAVGDSGRGGSTLTGRIRASTGRPVAEAIVVVEGSDSAASDAEGRFVLTRLPGGTQWLRARAVGFAPRETGVDLPSSGVDSLDLELHAITELDTITVVATARTRRVLGEVDERRKLGLGYTLGPDEIQRRVTLRSVLQSFPSVTVQGTMNSFTVFMRSGSMSPMSSAYCVADLRIDGIPSTWDLLSSYEPKDIAAVEVYPRASTVPLQYQNVSSTCGMVLVWTKYLR